MSGPDLIVAVNLRGHSPEMIELSPERKRDRWRTQLSVVCDQFSGLVNPCNGRPIQIKLNVSARALGTGCFEIVRDAGLNLFLDWKLGPDVLDTMWSDIGGLVGYDHIRRFTFRVETQEAFLDGKDDQSGAVAMLPNCSFLPVGPITDLPEDYFSRRQLNADSRSGAMRRFGEDVANFRDVYEVICSPADIKYFPSGFWDTRKPITPAIRPVGLGGNTGNSGNALTVEAAIRAGSAGLVIGSPIMQAEDLRAAAELVLKQMAAAM